jgi:uncharacterized protein (TIGR02687 family)
MDINDIVTGINSKLEECRIVFWQDDESEFTDELENIKEALADQWTVINTDEISHLQVKYHVELVEPEKTFLLYGTRPLSKPELDWLYDVRVYSSQFFADKSSIIVSDLDINMQHRQFITDRKAFFNSKQRVEKLKRMLVSEATEQDLAMTMMSVVLKLDSVSAFSIINVLLDVHSESSDRSDRVIADFTKYGIDQAFWTMLLNEYGYFALGTWIGDEQNPTIEDFLYKLLSTDCAHGLVSGGLRTETSPFLSSLASNVLPLSTTSEKLSQLPENVQTLIRKTSSKRSNAITFVNNWRNHGAHNEDDSYRVVVERIQNSLEIGKLLAEVSDPEKLLHVQTFELVEQQIIKLLAKDLPAFSALNVSDWSTNRISGYWARVEPKYRYSYQSMRAARDFYALKQIYADGFEFETAAKMYKAYEDDIHKFDYHYRVFSENAIKLSRMGKDILKNTGLVDDINELYVDWYLHDVAIAWGKLIESESLLETWKLPGIKSQQNFYAESVKSIFEKSQTQKVVVIISDALRYEAALEIKDKVNNAKGDKNKFVASISSQLGVLPSYTQLGMGSLLPHEKMSAHLGKSVEYKIDGTPVHKHEDRCKVLGKHNSLAFKSNEVLNWNNDEGRKNIEGAQVIYIYHNVIDATGDSASTEDLTFDATRTTIEELHQLSARVMNKLNVTRVLITADHGFLFKMTDVTETDKTKLNNKPEGAVVSKKRYVIGKGLPSSDNYWKGLICNTSNVDPELGDSPEFLIPKGSNRFHFVGGARFIHGGAMPQEVCVPIVEIKRLKGEKAQDKYSKQKVGVVPLSNPIRIVSNIDSIHFLQSDKVGESHKQRDVEIWIEDPNGKRISSLETVIFASTSDNLDDRKVPVQVKLQGINFDKHIAYKLKVKDTDGSNSTTTHAVTINLAIEDDFF